MKIECNFRIWINSKIKHIKNIVKSKLIIKKQKYKIEKKFIAINFYNKYDNSTV
jgi:hypothetical protein